MPIVAHSSSVGPLLWENRERRDALAPLLQMAIFGRQRLQIDIFPRPAGCVAMVFWGSIRTMYLQRFYTERHILPDY